MVSSGTVHGNTGPISEADFRRLIEFEEILDFKVDGVIMNRHFFNIAGLEVGYWSPTTCFGFIFDEPRRWSKKFKQGVTGFDRIAE